MTAPTVHSMKSTGYAQIRVRSLTHARRLREVLFPNKINVLTHLEQLGAEPPYYVWDGPTQGWATHPMRKGLARGPPCCVPHPRSDDGGPYRQAHDRRRLPPDQPPKTGEPSWLRRL